MKRMVLIFLWVATLAGCGVDWFPVTTATSTSTSLAITTTTLAAASVGTAYSQTLTATGGTAPYSWSVSSGTLPAGLTLSSGVISGTPTTAGSTTFTVMVSDSSNPVLTATQSMTIQVT